ncbi:MAG: hypothetical protein QW614_04140 [Candidatus Caldarchaeum sp.]|uniref:30S ribosomal protein S24e n=1 Tax=Caldiarchaeum subterraneum TaxID=311458 RepID=A0A7C5L9U5_CALS0
MSIASAKMIENKLIGRREVKALVSFQKTLTRDEIRQLLAEHYKTNPSNVIIKKAVFVAGARTINVHAHIYASAEDVKKYEPEHILIRNKIIERVKK